LASFEEGIVLVKGDGKCDQCDGPIKAENYVEATFKVDLIVNIPIKRKLCLECAERLADTIKKRLREAGWK